MQRLLFMVILAVILIGLPLSVLSHTVVSAKDAAISDKALTDTISKAANSSTSAAITITIAGISNK